MSVLSAAGRGSAWYMEGTGFDSRCEALVGLKFPSLEIVRASVNP